MSERRSRTPPDPGGKLLLADSAGRQPLDGRHHLWLGCIQDEALVRLESIDERRCRILEQRYFGGLTLEETAGALDVSVATVKRELRSARAWLALELNGEPR